MKSQAHSVKKSLTMNTQPQPLRLEGAGRVLLFLLWEDNNRVSQSINSRACDWPGGDGMAAVW